MTMTWLLVSGCFPLPSASSSTGDTGSTGSGSTAGTTGGRTTDGTCRERIDHDLPSSTTWTDGPGCDYFVEGVVQVGGLLTIEPGVTVQFGEAALLAIEGQLVAVGEPGARIRLQGAKPVTGYWKGVMFGTEPRPSRIEFVDIADAGEDDFELWGEPSAVFGYGGETTFEHVTVTNSWVHGAQFARDRLDLTSFTHNTFAGNELAGLLIDPDLVEMLDDTSDYLGVGDENGVPAVRLMSELTRDATWRPLNAPYLTDGQLAVTADLTLAPGVTVLVPEGGDIVVEDVGSLRAVGTASAPITLRGEVERAGSWEGLWFFDARGNELDHVDIAYGGGDGLLQLEGNIHVSDEADLVLSHSVVHDSDEWGVSCEPGNRFVDAGGNTFVDNRRGDLSNPCE